VPPLRPGDNEFTSKGETFAPGLVRLRLADKVVPWITLRLPGLIRLKFGLQWP